MAGIIRPDTTDESLGMRLHEVNRQRAVERAIERLRHGLKVDWHYLSDDDLVNLRWLLGEMWSVSTHAEWDELQFSKLGFENARTLIGQADRLRRHGTRRMATLEAARTLVVTAQLAHATPETPLDGASFAY
jgi:hypothetical protein